ncbi:MAG: hypothetical protein FJ318_07775 [SAR202 cluster bacterium]|nr:hypothetical protein [SAR202 cluster bacterium]
MANALSEQDIYDVVRVTLGMEARHLADSITGTVAGYLLRDASVGAVVVNLSDVADAGGALAGIAGVDVYHAA